MRVLVTGHLGYIGRRLTPLLEAAGHEWVGLDRDADIGSGSSFDIWEHPCSTAEFARDCEPDAVIHLAAKCRAGESIQWPSRYWNHNVVGTANLLHGLCPEIKARRFTGRFVLASTLLAAWPESSPYAASKYACEQMVKSCAAAHAFSAVICRIGNAAGGADPTPGRLIPAACAAARTGAVMPLHAGQATRDGTAARDYVHVADVAAALLAALAAPAGPRETLRVDVGTGLASTSRDVLAAVARAAGKIVRTEQMPARPGDVAVAVASAAPAQKVLGWRATKSLDDIARSAWEAENERH